MTACVLLFAVPVCSSFAEPYIYSKSDNAEVVVNLSELLNEHYVFPEVATSVSRYLQDRLNSDAYDTAENADQFAEMLTQDLQLVSNDRHLGVRPLAVRKARSINFDAEVEQLVQRRAEKLDNYGLEKVEILEGNVGYLKMNGFSDHDSAKQIVAAMMSFLTNVDALIIDMRHNVGGNSDMLRYFSSYFLPPNTVLTTQSSRGGSESKEFRSLEKALAHKMYDVPLFILTSNKTASAAEAFSFVLQEYTRCTIVGEKTAGLANAGRVFRLNPSYKIFISTKHVVGPVSGKNWGKEGVVPDLETSAENTFEKAYDQAKEAAVEFGDYKIKAKIIDIKESVQHLILAESKKDESHLESTLKKVLDELREKWALDETAINDMGYRYLQQHDNPTVARYVFAYNRDAHPTSGNVYSSLADAYVELNLVELAVENYKFALTIDPDDEYAQEMLGRISQKMNDD